MAEPTPSRRRFPFGLSVGLLIVVALVAVAFIVVNVPVAQVKPLSKQLNGKWEFVDSNGRGIEFLPDGAIEVWGGDDTTRSGKYAQYQWLSEDRIGLTSRDKAAASCRVEIDHEQLKLLVQGGREDGRVRKLKRVR
jgi:hypothetical protein